MLCLVCHCYACHNEAEHRCQVIICFASTTSAELHGEIPCPFTSFASPSSSDFALHAKHIPLDFTHALFRAKSVCVKSLTPKLPFQTPPRNWETDGNPRTKTLNRPTALKTGESPRNLASMTQRCFTSIPYSIMLLLFPCAIVRAGACI